MKDPRPLVDHVYQMFVDARLNNMIGTSGLVVINKDLFQAIFRESRVQLPGHPLHNKHINYYNHRTDDKENRDTTPVYTPSRYYEFNGMREDVQCDIQHTEQDADQPECGIEIDKPDEAVTQSLLTTCHNISRHQPLTDLRMNSVRCRDLPAAVEAPIMSRNARSLRLREYDLPVRFTRNILRQLIDSDCVTLQMLVLYQMHLSPVEGEFRGLSTLVGESWMSWWSSLCLTIRRVQLKRSCGWRCLRTVYLKRLRRNGGDAVKESQVLNVRSIIESQIKPGNINKSLHHNLFR